MVKYRLKKNSTSGYWRYVERWVRNVEKKNTAFWLQTASDKFYPDVVVRLTTGTTLVVEYKGGYLADTRDTRDSREKKQIRDLWARRSNDKCNIRVGCKQELAAITRLRVEGEWDNLSARKRQFYSRLRVESGEYEGVPLYKLPRPTLSLSDCLRSRQYRISGEAMPLLLQPDNSESRIFEEYFFVKSPT